MESTSAITSLTSTTSAITNGNNGGHGGNILNRVGNQLTRESTGMNSTQQQLTEGIDGEILQQYGQDLSSDDGRNLTAQQRKTLVGELDANSKLIHAFKNPDGCPEPQPQPLQPPFRDLPQPFPNEPAPLPGPLGNLPQPFPMEPAPGSPVGFQPTPFEPSPFPQPMPFQPAPCPEPTSQNGCNFPPSGPVVYGFPGGPPLSADPYLNQQGPVELPL